MGSRNKVAYRTYLSNFITKVIVVCPKCSGRATVHADEFSFQNRERTIKVTCSTCGFNKVLDIFPTRVSFSAGNRKIARDQFVMIIGAPIDPFFHLPLWMQENVNGNVLWAYNSDHLAFIRSFVEAKLRERNGQELSNQALGSRLPKWMTSKSNREAVLRAIERIKLK